MMFAAFSQIIQVKHRLPTNITVIYSPDCFFVLLVAWWVTSLLPLFTERTTRLCVVCVDSFLDKIAEDEGKPLVQCWISGFLRWTFWTGNSTNTPLKRCRQWGQHVGLLVKRLKLFPGILIGWLETSLETSQRELLITPEPQGESLWCSQRYLFFCLTVSDHVADSQCPHWCFLSI